MQVMAKSSAEGTEEGLGWIDAHVQHLSSLDPSLRLPHMGWNTIISGFNNPIISTDSSVEFYFLHSFGFTQLPAIYNPSFTEYSSNFVSSFAYKNIFGVQFHPEKSHKFGQDLIHRFCTFDFTAI